MLHSMFFGKVRKPFLLSLVTLFGASAVSADAVRQQDFNKASKTLRKRVIVKKADDDAPVPNATLNTLDPAALEALEERWNHLSSMINRDHRTELVSQVPSEEIRPWTPPADTFPMTGMDPLHFEVNSTPSSVAAGSSSVINEPSVAAVGDYVFYTANWYAASSMDGGASWEYVNPYSGPFTEPEGQTFCCNQQVHHDAATNSMFWLQQLIPDSSDDAGSQRVNIDLDSNGTWDCFYDVAPQDAEFSEKSYPDFPDLSVSDGFLFLTSNVFPSGGGNFEGAFVARLPLPDVTACQTTTADFYTETSHGAFRTTQGAGDTMYFADFASQTSLEIWAWRDDAPEPSSVTRTIRAFQGASRSCTDPAGDNWCGSIGTRVMAGAVGGDRVAFLWVSGENPSGGFPFPYTQGVVLDATRNLEVIEEPLIWSNDAAWAYPSLAANGNGDFGGTVLWGGGTFYPRCSAFLVDDQNGDSFSPFEHQIVISSEGGSGSDRSGDFLSTRVHSSNDKVYAGSCFGYPEAGVGESRYVLFGRESDFLAPTIFGDDFELGNFSAWSGFTP